VFDQLFVSTTPLQRTVSIYWLVAVLPFISVSRYEPHTLLVYLCPTGCL